jgi:hypothetical protein
MPPKRRAEDAALPERNKVPEEEAAAAATNDAPEANSIDQFTMDDIMELSATPVEGLVGNPCAHLVLLFRFILSAHGSGVNLFQAQVRCLRVDVGSARAVY